MLNDWNTKQTPVLFYVSQQQHKSRLVQSVVTSSAGNQSFVMELNDTVSLMNKAQLMCGPRLSHEDTTLVHTKKTMPSLRNGLCSCDGKDALDELFEELENVWGVNGKALKSMFTSETQQQCCVHKTTEEDEQRRAALQLIQLFSWRHALQL